MNSKIRTSVEEDTTERKHEYQYISFNITDCDGTCFQKMGLKLYFHVTVLIYFASTTATSVSKTNKIASNNNTKSDNPNENEPHLTNSQAIVCYDYTGQVPAISYPLAPE